MTCSRLQEKNPFFTPSGVSLQSSKPQLPTITHLPLNPPPPSYPLAPANSYHLSNQNFCTCSLQTSRCRPREATLTFKEPHIRPTGPLTQSVISSWSWPSNLTPSSFWFNFEGLSRNQIWRCSISQHSSFFYVCYFQLRQRGGGVEETGEGCRGRLGPSQD